MGSKQAETQALRQATRAEKLLFQQERADEAAIEQRKAIEARDQKTARLREQRLAAEAVAAAEAPQKRAAAKSSAKPRRAVGG